MFLAAARAGVELYAGNLADASSLIAEAYAITDATDGRNVPYAPVETEYHRKAMRSQWLTVGAETDPLTRARQLQRSWERLLAGGALGPELPPGATAGLRPTIVESWRRSLATGLDPTDLLAPIEADVSEVLERWFEHPLASLTHILTEQLRKVAEESRGIAVVTDASGLVLHRVGDEGLKERSAPAR